MKKILLSILVLVSFNSFAQNDCATAVNITANGDYTTGTVSGTHPFSTPAVGWCWNTNSASPNALWYTFTPATSGLLSISAALPINDPLIVDTRLSILTGSCGGPWTCEAGNDDVSDADYRSELLDFAVTAGTTYYIIWDNRWSDNAFTFNLTFTAVSCFAPTVHYLPDYLSTSSADLYWDQASPTPSTYDVDWSNDFSVPAGSGTIVSVPAGAQTFSTANITAPASSNFRYFVRSNCNPELSAWAGPYYAYLPVSLPYSNDFESSANNYRDGFIGFSLVNSTDTSNPPNYADGGVGFSLYTFNSTSAASNLRGYFRGVTMANGETATVSFKTRLFSFTGSSSAMTFNLTVGASQSAADQTTIVQSYSNSSDAAYTTHTATFTAPADGIYYFSIHNNSPIGATETFMFIDTIDITTNLSSEDFNLAKISVYPNPANDVLNITSELATIQTVSVVDLNGRTVKQFEVNNTNSQINVSDLNAGVYMLNIQSEEGKTVKKFIKN